MEQMPLGINKRKLQDIKDELIVELLTRGLTYEEIAHIFGMTTQGAWKAAKRYRDKS